MPTIDLSDIGQAVSCPKNMFFLYHNHQIGLFRAAVSPIDETFEVSEEEYLVHCTDLSFFAPYLVFLQEPAQVQAAGQIQNLIAQTTAIVLSPTFREFDRFPLKLEILYRITIHRLRKCQRGCFLTDLFLIKLRELTYRIWRHVGAYLKFCREKVLPQPIVSEYLF